MIDDISNEASEIIFAFQFQDITTQQLEHVNRILEAIYERFVTLFESSLRLKSSTTLGNNVIEAIEGELGTKSGEKTKKDFEKQTEDKIRHTGISQDKIDDFFKNQSKS
jgi:chemotaxis regulatin CheY-phosphate phosphatase CheZ